MSPSGTSALALRGTARDAAFIVAVAERDLHPLDGSISRAGFTVGVEAVELHIDPLVRALAGVDSAAQEVLQPSFW